MVILGFSTTKAQLDFKGKYFIKRRKRKIKLGHVSIIVALIIRKGIFCTCLRKLALHKNTLSLFMSLKRITKLKFSSYIFVSTLTQEGI